MSALTLMLSIVAAWMCETCARCCLRYAVVVFGCVCEKGAVESRKSKSQSRSQYSSIWPAARHQLRDDLRHRTRASGKMHDGEATASEAQWQNL